MAYASHFLVCALFMFYEGVVGVPTPATTTVTTQAYPDFNTNLGTAFANMQGGIQRLTRPMFNLGFNILPNLVYKGVGTAHQAFGKIMGAKKDAVAKVTGGVGDVVGSGVVLGSAVAGSAMKVAGSGLGALNQGITSGADAGLSIVGNLGEKAAQVNEYGGNIASGALHRFANVLQTSAGSTNKMSDSLSNMVDSIANYLSKSIHDSGNRVVQTIDVVSQRAADGTTQNVAALRATLVNLMNFTAQMSQSLVEMLDNVSTSIAAASTNGANAAGVATGTATASPVGTTNAETTAQTAVSP